MIEDSYFDYEEDSPINNGPNLKKIIWIALGVILVIIILLAIKSFNKVDTNSYAYVEKQMIQTAQKYVMDNNIVSSNEIYLDVGTINFKVPETCNMTSGVFVQDDNYKAYLSCQDYESKILKNSNVVKLNGKEIMVLYREMNYSEPGYSSQYNVHVSGFVGKEEGVYNLLYAPEGSNDLIVRKVAVINNPNVVNLYPVIRINGKELEIIYKGSTYNDSGAVAFDKTDGDISNKIVKNNLPNMNVSGEYNISYMVKNNMGYYSSTTRKVLVIENETEVTALLGLDDERLTSSNVQIIVNVFGSNYQYTMLPNGQTNNSNSFSYEVSENGTYRFVIVDKNGKQLEKEITVSNISKDKPIATCSAVLYNDKTSVDVISTSRILHYRYHIGNINSTYLVSNQYIGDSTNTEDVRVDIRDVFGNENTISCAIINNKYNEVGGGSGQTGGNQEPTYDKTGYKQAVKGTALHMKLPSALSARGNSIAKLNNCIANRVRKVGPGTRYGVVEAGVGLIECMKEMTGYVLSYDHWGGKIDQVALYGKLGVNPRWGTQTEGHSSSCASDVCYLGIDCASFVRWALCNGGMNFCSKKISSADGLASKTYFPEADAFRIHNKKLTHVYGKDYTGYDKIKLLQMLKPGDVIYTPKPTEEGQHHIMLVVGIESDAVYIAENGSKIRKITFSSLTSSGTDNTFFLLDRFYANTANRNNLY